MCFLFVEKPVLDRRLDSSILQAPNARFHSNSSEVRVRGKALPVAATVRRSAQCAPNGPNVPSQPGLKKKFQSSDVPQSNLSAFTLVLESQVMKSVVYKVTIPGRSNRYSGRKHAHIVGWSYCIWAILETEACEIQTQNRSNVPNTRSGNACDEPRFFIKGER